MADTVRQKIVAAVKTRFETITTANGYRTDIGNKVTAWRSVPFEPGDEGLDVRDMGGAFNQALANVHEQVLRFETDVVTNGETTPAELRKMIADVVQAIGVDRYWNDGSANLAQNTRLVDDDIGVKQAGKIAGGSTIKFDITYRFAGFDMETLA